jgi:acyl dehydratase
MSYGKYFEELRPGETLRHWPGRTINEYDGTLLSLLSMNQHPVHIDEHYARGTQHGRRLVTGPTVISIVIGLTQGDVGGRAIDTLSYSEIRHAAPVFHGDTLYAESIVVKTEALPGRRGSIVVETRATNQKQEIVLSLTRKIVVPSKAKGDK